MYDYLVKLRKITEWPDHEAIKQLESAETIMLEIFILRQMDDSELRKKSHLIPQVQAMLVKRKLDATVQEKTTVEKLIKLSEESVALGRDAAVWGKKNYHMSERIFWVSVIAAIAAVITLLKLFWP